MSEASASGVPRIALIHALEESVLPIRKAFLESWPEAERMDLLDASLSSDLAAAGRLDQPIMDRFLALGRYAAGAKGVGGQAAAILFTCSAFGRAIEAVKGDLPIPVLRPNEAGFANAIELGERIALVVTFPPSLPSLTAELEMMARERGKRISIVPVLADGALASLKAGDVAAHDEAVVRACEGVSVDVLLLGQFSLARAADPLREYFSGPIVTTPASAVAKLRNLLG